MRKPLRARRFKLGNPKHFHTSLSVRSMALLFFFILVFQLGNAHAQCTPASGTIEGTIFMDGDYDGQYDPDEFGAVAGIIDIYDSDGHLVASTSPSANGYYQVSGLSDGDFYVVVHTMPDHLSPAISGPDHRSEVRRIEVPACDVRFGVVDPTLYCDSDNPSIAVTCFVKGASGVNDDMETVVYTDFLFNANTAVSKIAVKGETGSVFGSAWSSGDQTLYSSTFIKQDAFVKDDPGTIYQSRLVNGQYETNKWVSLNELGVDVGTLAPEDASSCDYGAQVGKLGIGGMEISPDEAFIYVVNLHNKSLVIIDRLDPSPATTMEIPIMAGTCSGGEMRPFGVSYHDGLFYVTATCDASVSKASSDHTISVLTFDPKTKIFSEALSTDFSKNYWRDSPSDNSTTGQWLMDIDFTSDGHMVLGIADRLAHRYCNVSRVLQNQYPDILMAWYDNGVWKLENNGRVADLIGSGVGNGQGPGGGEFFGEDRWVLAPLIHPETATGTVYCLPGSNEVVATVFDPLYNSYSGGFHRYDGRNGEKTGAIELYNNSNQAVFGKGSGLGNIIDMCGAAPQEIGNYVWFDSDMDGIQDADEASVDGLELTLYNDQCEVIATTTTNAGHYYFSDGIDPHSTYYVAITDARWSQNEGKLDMNGEIYHLTVLDAEGDSRDSDMREVDLPCQPGLLAVEVHTSGPGFSNHSFDIGLSEEPDIVVEPDTFDLALVKKALVDGPVKLGQMVDFEITIYNQGNVAATNIEVVDYIPTGLSFQGAFNPGWGLVNGLPVFTYTGVLEPGQATTITLKMQVREGRAANDYINYAEISRATNLAGEEMDDIDSVADSDVGNDVGGQPGGITDNMYLDNGQMDEDDHDPASLQIFDLALMKTTSFVQTVQPGDDVIFLFQIYNQGNIASSSVTLTDYFPAGLELSPNDTYGWVQNGQNATIKVDEEIAPGSSHMVYMIARVTEDARPGEVVNFGEITKVGGPNGEDYTDKDFDSTADDDMNNDNGGEPEGPTDNEIEDNGVTDEDDHDPSTLHIFDLALRKTVDKASVSSADEVATYTFEVFNQGDVLAQNIVVHDRLPEGLNVDASVNSGWTEVEDRIWAFDIPGSIAAGASFSFTLQATVGEDYLGQTFVNTAEIVYAEDDKGVLGRDFDSRFDQRDDNDAGGEVEGSTDNMIDDHGGLDEDDHDPAILRSNEPAMLMHDVSLSKSTQNKFLMGDTVVFELTVHNEGQYTFGEVKVIDYLPFFLVAADDDWEPHPMGHVGTLSTQNGLLPPQGLLPGESATIEFMTIIDSGAFPGYLLNSAEIGYVVDIDGTDITALDKDSSADFDPRNDVSNNPKEQQGGAGPGSRPVEDDRAAFEILIYMAERLGECDCLNNDIGNTDGGFGETVVVTSASDETWYVDIARDIFRDQSYTPFVTGPGGFQLTEFNLGGGLSEYSLTGYFPEGSSYYLVLKNVEEEAAVDISGGQDCVYARPGIDGQVNVCIGSETEYEVINPSPGGVYDWYVDPAGGTIVGSTSGNKIRVQWDDSRGGPYTIWVNEVSPDNCVGPSEIEVTIGDQFIYSVSCVSQLNVTIGPDCETRVVPEMLLVGGPYDYSSFNVMLTDKHGNPISGATLTYEHVGTQVMAKVINSCTGNSCWATLNVEDKTAPEIMCFSDTIRCISIGQYAYPRAIDGCDPSPVVTLVDEIVEPLDCDPLFIKRVTRMFVAEDQYGNVSDTCTQVIMLERIVLNEIDYPDSMTVVNGMALECNMYESDSLGFPTTEVTGIPTYRGLPIYPQEYYCNVGVNYHDIELPSTGCVRKFIREWRVFEWWCTSEVELIRYPQYIEIQDNIAPSVVCPDVHYVKANTRTCDADVFIDMPVVSDTCSDIFRIDLVYPGGIIENYTPRELTFPLDTSEVKIRAYDECFNVDSCSFLVIVEDDQPPVPVCDQFTTVGLTDTGLAYIYAETFDDGSYDNCDLKLMEVKRMDDGSACGIAGAEFGPYVEFCCEDIGRNVMVMLRVTDKAGLSNTCMIEVEVQDKIPPIIHCPPADTIDCDFHYDTSDLSIFGEPVVHDNCDYTLTEMVFENVDQCREGYIERVWIARDSNNTVSCSQRIYIINSSPFDSSNIEWPEDFDTTECINALLTPDLLPEEYAFPKVDEDFCDLVGVTYTDQTFDFSNSNEACYKILRTWKIINWCRFDSSQYSQWTHEQVIKVNDDVAPIITSSCERLEMPVIECDSGYIELVATGTDSCTEDAVLRWEYHIDYDSDGIVDDSDSGFGPMIDASRMVPLGDHNVRWVFEDRCGNRTVCTQEFLVYSTKPPTVYCKNGLIVDLIPMDLNGDGDCDTEMVEVWAVDLDDSSVHPCGDSLIYSIGTDTSMKSVVYDCDSMGRREVVICVTDPRGNQACCTTFVVVQDNNMMDCCPKDFDKDCVTGPPDINLLDCDAATDPDDLMSRPVTSSCEVDSIITTFMDEDATTGDNCEKIKRTWSVVIYLDGRDTTCLFEQCITIDNEFNGDSIIWPDSTLFLPGCDPSLDTSNTGGVPMIRGEYCDYVTIEWADERVERPDTVCTYYERTWTITNECDNDKEYEFVQLIVLRNQTPPVLTVPSDTIVVNDPGECEAEVILPPVTFTDCSSGVTIVNSFNNGGANASGTYPVGKTVVIFTATDTCGNVAMDSTCVTVEDREAPMIVCPQDMTFDCGVDIDTLDFGVVTAMDICSDVTIEEDTVYNLNPCSVGTIIRTITVRDTSGNDTSCVQTITIDIENAFDSSRISLAQDSIFFGACDSIDLSRGGEPTLDLVGLSCFAIGVTSSDSMYTDTCDGEPCGIIERTWTVTDTCQLDGMGGGVWTIQQYFVIRGGMLQVFCPPDTIVDCTADLTDLSVFGDFDFTSPCGIDTVIRDSMIMLNECDLGMIFRSITVRDTAGNEATCQQKITVEDANPFTEANIMWPEDTLMLDGCGSLDPDSLLSRPIIDTSAAVCYDISVSFMDSVSSSCLQTPCVLVLRTWTVVDSCALDSMGNGLYTFTQRIEVNDTVAPVFNVSGIDTTIILDPDSCDFFVGNLVVSATDCADSITITNNSPFADAGGADASGMYPIGVTNFYFFAEDPCCNIDSIPVRVELQDTVQVTLNCTKVIKEIRDSLAMVKFFVDEGTVVPATCRDLRLSFSLTDPNDTCRIYNCDSVRSRGTPAPIWAWKIYLFEDDVLIDSCDILHQVIEINRVCFGGSLGATVSGLIQTNRYSPVREAQVHLEGGGLPDKMTDEYGVYQFEPMPLGGKYLVEPGKNDDPLNGVTTKDLILIQRHLLGIRPFNNPYDFIAADINKSDEITAGDIIMLRRLLLGYYTAFPENTSWRFVDEGYSFPDPLDPWLEVFPETYEIDPLEQHMNVNFVGVKIGDVSGDVGLEGDISTRDSERFLIELEEREGHIHFYKAEGLSFDGVQFTLEWTPSDEEFELVFDENTVMGDEHFGFHSVDEGVLTVVLDEEMSQDRMYMFSLPKALVQGEMRITSRVTRSMAITKDLGSVDVAWADKAVQEDTPSFTLYQNRPNPFKEGTVIGFDLPEDQEARLTILNVSGQIVHMVEGQFERGYNEIEIRTEDLLESGVYYYRLDCAGSSQTLKMINID